MAPVAHERGASTALAPAATPPPATAAAPAAPSGVPVHERARAKVPAATRWFDEKMPRLDKWSGSVR